MLKNFFGVIGVLGLISWRVSLWKTIFDPTSKTFWLIFAGVPTKNIYNIDSSL
jgi:hypothetical protein